VESSFTKKEHYVLQRAALEPLFEPGCFHWTEYVVNRLGEAEFLNFIRSHRLASLWARELKNRSPECLSDLFYNSLNRARLHTTANYIIQRNCLKDIRDTLDSAGIEHVVYKGADIRERYYSEPELRPAGDIDLLVREDQKVDALLALKRSGFSFCVKKQNISHELSVLKGRAHVDLHWNIMRPGRTRISMTDVLLASRNDFVTHWGMSNEANLFVMLVHPVFTKYSTTEFAQLVRMVDLHRLIALRPDLDKTYDLLDRSGIKTAGWITLRWLQILSGHHKASKLQSRLAPGKIRQAYFDQWLKNSLSTRLLRQPLLIHFGFTLHAHDKLSDSFNAIKMKRVADSCARDDLQRLENVLGEP
jgi:hypothetical protein